MKFTKLASTLSGLAAISASLTPLSASALSAASMSLTGSSNTTGNFAVTVYENTGADTVTSANVALDFTGSVTNVSYDYSVGPFVAVTPSGAHNAYGTVTGTQPVATVRFTVTAPSTVTASVGAASYLKHAGDTAVESFTINRGSADFTYTKPVVTAPTTPTTPTKPTKPTTGTSTGTTTGTGSTTTTTGNTSGTKNSGKNTNGNGSKNNGNTKNNSGNKNNSPKNVSSRRTSTVATSLVLIAVLAAGVYLLLIRKPAAVTAVANYKLFGSKTKSTAAKKAVSKKTVKKTKKA